MYPSISAKQEIILPDESSIYFNLVIKLLVFHPSTVKAKQKTNLELFLYLWSNKAISRNNKEVKRKRSIFFARQCMQREKEVPFK